MALALPILLVVWFEGRRVVVWELFGRMLFAHIPVTFIMVPAMFGDKVAYSTFMASPLSSQLSMLYIVLMLLYVVAFVVWFFVWGYQAFRAVMQLKGGRGVMLYSVALYGSYLLSEYAIGVLMRMEELYIIYRYKKKGKLLISHRYNRIPLLNSLPGGVLQELVV